MSNPWDRLGRRIGGLKKNVERYPEGSNLALSRLEGLGQVRRALEHEIDREVIRAREYGAAWHLIGKALRMTGQGAQYRYQQALRRSGRIPPSRH